MACSRSFQQPYLLRLIVSRQLAQMYAASLLGLLWSYVQPALRFAVYYVVMGFVLQLHEGTPYFAIHLFTGIVVVHYFGETWSGGTRSIWQNKALVKKMRMPREIFPVASMLVAAYHTLPQVLAPRDRLPAHRLAPHLDGARRRRARRVRSWSRSRWRWRWCSRP